VNIKEAQILSKCHRPGGPASQDTQVQKAARMVAADPALKEALAAQVEFDDRQARLVDSIKPGEPFLEKIDDTLEHLQKGFQWSALRHPAFLAGAVAVLVVIGVLFYVVHEMAENFPGRDSVEKMVDTIDHLGARSIVPKTTTAGDLEDWFFNKGFDDFHILPQFAAMDATGCRVFTQDDHSVAQIALASHNAFLNIYRLADFDVQLDPPDRWRLFQQGDWAVATRADNGAGYTLMFKGTKSDMQGFVDGLK
jgi:hypothetical protein